MTEAQKVDFLYGGQATITTHFAIYKFYSLIY